MEDVVAEAVQLYQSATSKQELVSAGYETLSIPFCAGLQQKLWPKFMARMKQFDTNDQDRVVVGVDFSAIFHAFFYIYEDSAAQETINKIDSFRTIKPTIDRFIVAVDSTDGYWRQERYPEYKSSRKPKPDGFHEIRDKAMSMLREREYRIEQRSKFESDDILSSIAFMAKVRKQQAVLVTDDRDLLQCLGPGVTIYSPRAKELRDADWLLREMKITPKQVVDWLCLVGKDDIPSPSKIGEVTASQWLESYGSMIGIYDARDKLTKLKRETIEQYVKSDFWLARDLHTLARNLDIFWD